MDPLQKIVCRYRGGEFSGEVGYGNHQIKVLSVCLRSDIKHLCFQPHGQTVHQVPQQQECGAANRLGKQTHNNAI